MVSTRKRVTSAVAALVLAGAGVLTVVSAANATDGESTCTPIYSEQPNPDYVPAWDEDVPAVTHVVHHDAITHDVTIVDVPAHTDYQRYSWKPAGDVPPDAVPGDTSSTPLSASDDWQANTTDYAGAGHGTDLIGEAFFVGHGNGGDNGSWFYWTATEVPAVTHVETVVDTPAWDETVVDIPATVIHHDAVGTPTIQVQTGENCPPPPPPAPKACVASGAWYTEDVAPTATDAGLVFTGTGGAAVNWLHPVSGNVQGLGSVTYTLAAVSGYQAAYRLVVNPNAGTLHYASITVEPYMNGWVAGQDGTFMITSSSLAWSSKIASGPGSQGSPVSLSQFGTIWPDNVLLAIGIHLGSANPPTTTSTVTGITGCVAASFVVEPTPTPTPSDTPTVTPTPSPSATPVTVVADVSTPTALAETGSKDTWPLLGSAIAAILLGSGALVLAYRRRQAEQQ